MFKLLIAEDEALTREAIVRSIDFGALKFTLVASCEDGREAWAAYQREKPDLVLTDINMPNMSGLELAKAIHEDAHDCRVVILTGYDSFDFAKQAIRYQVVDYLLKPITPQELREMLTKNAVILEEKALKKVNLQTQLSQNYRTETLAKNQVLNRFIAGGIDRQSLEANDTDLHHLFTHQTYRLALLNHNVNMATLNELKLSSQDVQFLLMNLAEESAAEYPDMTVFPAVDNPIVVLCGGKEAELLEKELQNFIRALSQLFHELTKLDFRAGCSMSCSAEKLPLAKEQAAKALAFAMTSRVQVTVSYSEMRSLTQETLQRNREQLRQVVLSCRMDSLQAAVSDYVTVLRFSQLSEEELRASLTQLIEELEANDFYLPDAFNHFDKPLELLANNHLPLQESLKKLLRQSIDQHESGKSNSAKDLIRAARHYIEKNYASTELSLIKLCQQLNVSMSYFSSIFKSETGQTFIEYLTEVRMINAKKLLTEGHLMLYTVAEKVGYDSAAYFTAAFKKNTGFTPKEYRKRFSREDHD